MKITFNYLLTLICLTLFVQCSGSGKTAEELEAQLGGETFNLKTLDENSLSIPLSSLSSMSAVTVNCTSANTSGGTSSPTSESTNISWNDTWDDEDNIVYNSSSVAKQSSLKITFGDSTFTLKDSGNNTVVSGTWKAKSGDLVAVNLDGQSYQIKIKSIDTTKNELVVQAYVDCADQNTEINLSNGDSDGTIHPVEMGLSPEASLEGTWCYQSGEKIIASLYFEDGSCWAGISIVNKKINYEFCWAELGLSFDQSDFPKIQIINDSQIKIKWGMNSYEYFKKSTSKVEGECPNLPFTTTKYQESMESNSQTSDNASSIKM